MPAYKDKAKGTWYASFYYEDWTGKKVKKMKPVSYTHLDVYKRQEVILQSVTFWRILCIIPKW